MARELSMKEIFAREVRKRTSKMKPGERIRRNLLRRQILADSEIALTLLRKITHGGRKDMTATFILKRFDRIYSDALDQITDIYLEIDEKNPRVSWIVKDEVFKR